MRKLTPFLLAATLLAGCGTAATTLPERASAPMEAHFGELLFKKYLQGSDWGLHTFGMGVSIGDAAVVRTHYSVLVMVGDALLDETPRHLPMGADGGIYLPASETVLRKRPDLPPYHVKWGDAFYKVGAYTLKYPDSDGPFLGPPPELKIKLVEGAKWKMVKSPQTGKKVLALKLAKLPAATTAPSLVELPPERRSIGPKP